MGKLRGCKLASQDCCSVSVLMVMAAPACFRAQEAPGPREDTESQQHREGRH